MIQPELHKLASIAEVEQYMSDSETIKGLLLLSGNTEQDRTIFDTFLSMIKNGEIKTTGINV